MRIGVVMLPADPWPQARTRAQHLESLGFDHLWTYDHLSWRRFRDGPWFGAIPWLTGVATATSRIGLGTLVASPNFRHPVTLAKDPSAEKLPDYEQRVAQVLEWTRPGQSWEGTIQIGAQ